jgi:hypothetical protein
MAPYGLPWSTFSALIVTLASICISVIWAIADARRDPDS